MFGVSHKYNIMVKLNHQHNTSLIFRYDDNNFDKTFQIFSIHKTIASIGIYIFLCNGKSYSFIVACPSETINYYTGNIILISIGNDVWCQN